MFENTTAVRDVSSRKNIRSRGDQFDSFFFQDVVRQHQNMETQSFTQLRFSRQIWRKKTKLEHRVIEKYYPLGRKHYKLEIRGLAKFLA